MSVGHELSEHRQKFFWPKVLKADGCWLWTAAVGSNGYGSFWTGETTISPHLYMWLLLGNEQKDGFEVDHTCNNKLCVRPEHLEQVTEKENMARVFRRNPRSKCLKGHSLKDAYVRKNGTKRCKRCANAASVECRRRKRQNV